MSINVELSKHIQNQSIRGRSNSAWNLNQCENRNNSNRNSKQIKPRRFRNSPDPQEGKFAVSDSNHSSPSWKKLLLEDFLFRAFPFSDAIFGRFSFHFFACWFDFIFSFFSFRGVPTALSRIFATILFTSFVHNRVMSLYGIVHLINRENFASSFT